MLGFSGTIFFAPTLFMLFWWFSFLINWFYFCMSIVLLPFVESSSFWSRNVSFIKFKSLSFFVSLKSWSFLSKVSFIILLSPTTGWLWFMPLLSKFIFEMESPLFTLPNTLPRVSPRFWLMLILVGYSYRV